MVFQDEWCAHRNTRTGHTLLGVWISKAIRYTRPTRHAHQPRDLPLLQPGTLLLCPRRGVLLKDTLNLPKRHMRRRRLPIHLILHILRRCMGVLGRGTECFLRRALGSLGRLNCQIFRVVMIILKQLSSRHIFCLCRLWRPWRSFALTHINGLTLLRPYGLFPRRSFILVYFFGGNFFGFRLSAFEQSQSPSAHIQGGHINGPFHSGSRRYLAFFFILFCCLAGSPKCCSFSDGSRHFTNLNNLFSCSKLTQYAPHLRRNAKASCADKKRNVRYH